MESSSSSRGPQTYPRATSSKILAHSNNNNSDNGLPPNPSVSVTKTTTKLLTTTTSKISPPIPTNLNTVSKYFNPKDQLQLSGMTEFSSDSELDESYFRRACVGGVRDKVGAEERVDRLFKELVIDGGGNISDESSSSSDSVSVSMIKPTSAKEVDLTKTKEELDQQLESVLLSTPKQGKSTSPKFHTPGTPGRPGISSTSPPWKNTLGTGQVFTRAPNFRTPGGYKPPIKENEPRNLTAEQIQAEVREMYANPNNSDRRKSSDSNSPKTNKQTPERFKLEDKRKTTHSKSNSFQPDEVDKTKKDKLSSFLDDENIWGNVSGEKDKKLPKSKQVVSFGTQEVEEPLIARSRSYLCYEGEGQGGENKELGVLPYHYSELLCSGMPKNFCKQSNHDRSPPIVSSVSQRPNIIELDKLWKDIQDTKIKLKNEMESLHKDQPRELPSNDSSPRRFSLGKRALTPPTKFIEPLPFSVSPSPTKHSPEPSSSQTKQKKNYRKSGRPRTAKGVRRTQHKSSSFDIFGHDKKTGNSLVPIGIAHGDDIPKELLNIELSTLLKDTDMDESDLDDIISQLSAEFHSRDLVPGLDEKEADIELSKALQQLQVTEWGKTGNEDYSQKFYQEKFKRQHCEKEIISLQKELLESKESVAVLEGVLKAKETSIKKYALQWEGLVQQFRTYEKRSRTITSQLQIENNDLKTEAETNRLRLAEYEKELGKALQLSSDFKDKMDGILEDMERDKDEWKEEREQLNQKLSKMEQELENEKTTKDSTLRALHESQKVIDETQKLFEQKSIEVTKLSQALNISSTTLAEAVGEKEEAEKNLMHLNEEKQKLERGNQELKLKLEQVEKEKIALDSKYKTKLVEECRSLHDYYNVKVKELLQKENDKMVQAERDFVKDHENKLETMKELAETQLNDLKQKYASEISLLKARYETQIESLHKENEEKGKVLSTVSRQLLCYSGTGEASTSSSNVFSTFENIKTQSQAWRNYNGTDKAISSTGTESVTESVFSTKNVVTKEFNIPSSNNIALTKL